MRSIGIGASPRALPFNPVVRVMNNRMCDIDVLKGAPTLRGPEGGGDAGGGAADDANSAVGAAIASAVQWISTHAVQLGQWIGTLLHIGPSYDPANGGELARQFGPESEGGTGWLGQPWCNAYMDWLKNYRPAIWNGDQDVWTAGDAAPTPWKTVYDRYTAAGLPAGALLDANMVPVGLAQAQAAVSAQAAVENHPQAPPPDAAQLQALQIMAMQIAGLGTPADHAAASATYAQLPNGWKAYVDALVAIWQQSDAIDPATGGEPAKGGGLILAAVAAKVLGLF